MDETQPNRCDRSQACYSIADDERRKKLHYGGCGVLSLWLDLGFGSWKTGEGIAIGAGGAILMMILAVEAAAITAAAADGILAAGAAVTVRRRAMARRGLRSSRLAHR